MRLLIISNMDHYLREGRVVGWGPTVQELNHLATLFDEVRHIGVLNQTPAPPSALPYTAENLRLVPVPFSGGTTLGHKLGIVRRVPLYTQTMVHELKRADAVHIRCPANIPMLACLLLALRQRPKPRWIKYAGNWRPDHPESWSYTFQRWWLEKGWAGGRVTVNGRWPDQPSHVRSFLNPCLEQSEIAEGARVVVEKRLDRPVRFLFVGALNRPKGVGRALDIFAQLRRSGLDATFDLIGDGPDRPEFERQAARSGFGAAITFHGWLPRTVLGPLYARSHVFLFPTTSSEGWPKVLSEAMAYGVVPVAGAISSIPQVLCESGAGLAIDPENLEAHVIAIRDLVNHPDRWLAFSQAAARTAPAFSYEAYLVAVRGLFAEMGVNLNIPCAPLEDLVSSRGS